MPEAKATGVMSMVVDVLRWKATTSDSGWMRKRGFKVEPAPPARIQGETLQYEVGKERHDHHEAEVNAYHTHLLEGEYNKAQEKSAALMTDKLGHTRQEAEAEKARLEAEYERIQARGPAEHVDILGRANALKEEISGLADRAHETSQHLDEDLLAEAEEEKDNVISFRHSIEHAELVARMLPKWTRGINELRRRAKKDKPEVQELAHWIISTLHTANDLEDGTYPAAILILHDDGSGYMRVLSCTPAATASDSRIKQDAIWHSKNSRHALTLGVFQLLKDAHSYKDVQAEFGKGVKLQPLFEKCDEKMGIEGRCFGVLVTGPPGEGQTQDTLPVEFVTELGRWAGMLLETAWRRVNREDLIARMRKFIVDSPGNPLDAYWLTPGTECYHEHRAAHSKGSDSTHNPMSSSGDVGMEDFCPFERLDAKMTSYKMELRDSRNKEIGLMFIQRRDHKEITNYRIALLQTCRECAQEALKETDKLHVGDGKPTSLETLADAKLVRGQMMMPHKLQQQIRTKLLLLDERAIVKTVGSYRDPPASVVKVMCGVLCLVGRVKSHKAAWTDMATQIDNTLVPDMLKVDACRQHSSLSKTKKASKVRWKESKLCLKSVDHDGISGGGAAHAVGVMLAWLEAEHHIAAIATELREMDASKPISLEKIKEEHHGDIREGLFHEYTDAQKKHAEEEKAAKEAKKAEKEAKKAAKAGGSGSGH